MGKERGIGLWSLWDCMEGQPSWVLCPLVLSCHMHSRICSHLCSLYTWMSKLTVVCSVYVSVCAKSFTLTNTSKVCLGLSGAEVLIPVHLFFPVPFCEQFVLIPAYHTQMLFHAPCASNPDTRCHAASWRTKPSRRRTRSVFLWLSLGTTLMWLGSGNAWF